MPHRTFAPLLAALALTIGVLAPSAASAKSKPVRQQQQSAAAPGAVLVKEAKSKQLCEAVPGRIFVEKFFGTECIAYYGTTSVPHSVEAAVIYFNGDIPNEYFKKPRELDQYVTELNTSARFIADRMGVRIIFVARPGTFGSSGDHELRGERREMLMMNAAVDAIKARLGLTTIVLAGQSRGSQVAAVLLTMGRRDVSCAVLGSGSLFTVEIERQFRISQGGKINEARLRYLKDLFYDPSEHVGNIPRDAARRTFILGDRTDTITPFDQQEAFSARLRQHGHHAVTIEIKALGADMHGATHLALPAAALCAKGAPDQQIASIVGRPTPVNRPAGM